MIERIVENWLTNSTERAYQIPFAQVLSSQGYRIIHLSKHGVGEQGKDIIAQHPDGTFFAYQLKSGDMNKSKWQSIFGEIQELIELPLQYPTPIPIGNHVPILVINGVLSDDVRLSVQSLNQGNEKRGFKNLQVISIHELNGMFVQAHGNYLPIELTDLKAFLDLYSLDGRRNLDKHKLSDYLNVLLDASRVIGRADAQRKVTSAVLLVYYLLRNMSAVNNHVGLCEAWILLQAYILRFAHMSSLELDDINQTFSLIEQSIDFEVGLLKEEVYSKSGNFVEGTPIGDGGLMYSIRLTIVFGWLAAQECIQSTFIPNHVIDTHLLSLIDDNFAYLGVWSEYAIPFMAFICLAKYKAGHQKNAESLLATLLRTIVVLNNERRKSGFPNPYYTPDDLISSLYSMQGKEIDFTQFAGSSYTFRSLVDGLVYLNRRDLLEPMWKQIIETRSVEYYPSDPWDLLLWRSDQGQERDFGYEFPTSWNKLMSELPDSFELPIPLFSNPKFMTYFSLVYPHRFRRDLFMAILKTYIESSTP